MNLKSYSLVFLLLVCLYPETQATDAEKQEPAYQTLIVNAREGLNVRMQPSVSGEIAFTAPYGWRVLVFEKARKDTVDGITDYWYRTDGYGAGSPKYVFGGYLSQTLPPDVVPIEGDWISFGGEDFSRRTWAFNSNGIVFQGWFQQCGGWYGRWSFSEDTITISDWRLPGITKPLEMTIKAEIIDANTIILRYRDYESEIGNEVCAKLKPVNEASWLILFSHEK